MNRWSFLLLAGLALFGLAGCESAQVRAFFTPDAEAPQVARSARISAPAPALVSGAELPAAAQGGLQSIFFSSGTALIDAAGEAKLQSHALRLKQNPKLIVTLTGYTDDLGSRAYNLAIAEQRVDAVSRMLRSLGVPTRQLRRQGHVAEKLAQPCTTAECRQLMRRVDLVFSQAGQAS